MTLEKLTWAMQQVDNSDFTTPFAFSVDDLREISAIKASLEPNISKKDITPWVYLFENHEELLHRESHFNDGPAIFVGDYSEEELFALSQSQRCAFASQEWNGGSIETQCSLGTQCSQDPNSDDVSTLTDFLLHLNAQDVPEFSSHHLRLLTTINPRKVSNVDAAFDFERLSDLAVSFICREIKAVKPSYSWCAAFAECCLMKKVIGLKCAASGILITGLSDFAREFPRATVEGLMVPCTVQENIGERQCDLLNGIFKDHLLAEHQSMFLEQVLNLNFQYNENIIKLLSDILFTSGFVLHGKLLDQLIQALVESTMNLDNSLNFLRFIQRLISQLGSQFSRENVAALITLVSRNKSFLKKACLNALKKLQ